MALPADYSTVPVRGTYVYLDGTPAAGSVRITAPIVTKSTATGTVLVPTTLQADLDANGSFELDVPATDDPDIEPSGWSYLVVEKLDGGGGRTFELEVPVAEADTGISITD